MGKKKMFKAKLAIEKDKESKEEKEQMKELVQFLKKGFRKDRMKLKREKHKKRHE